MCPSEGKQEREFHISCSVRGWFLKGTINLTACVSGTMSCSIGRSWEIFHHGLKFRSEIAPACLSAAGKQFCFSYHLSWKSLFYFDSTEGWILAITFISIFHSFDRKSSLSWAFHTQASVSLPPTQGDILLSIMWRLCWLARLRTSCKISFHVYWLIL